MKIEEQEKVLRNKKKNMLVSASAGSGKTYIMIKYIAKLICEDKVPVKDLLVLTFTKAAANEMKDRLERALKESGDDEFVVEQIDALSVSNISTIHSFCEKSLKKYANMLGLNDNFLVIDENMSQKIKQTAFENAWKEYNQKFPQEYSDLVAFYKNDKSKIKEIVFEIEKLVNAVADKDNFVDSVLTNGVQYFEKAIEFLWLNAKNVINDCMKEVELLHVADFEIELQSALRDVLSSKDLYKMSEAFAKFKFPNLPKRKEAGDEIVDKADTIKTQIANLKKKIVGLNLADQNNIKFQKNSILEKNILKFFKIYENFGDFLKKSQNCVDFYDLEKYMKVLSQKENLFSSIKYVFVDEYQDTNKVQERIIKNIAKNSNFVAVGDVKQGIYGFRLASSEIFLADLENFERDEDSVVNYLKSNFRSSQKVLDFVNDIFSVCMTKDFCGVDYLNGSMLKGRTPFVDDGQKAISIDIVAPQESVEKILPKVYSVKNDEVTVENKKEKVLLDIKRRINECLSSKISVDGQLRQCKYSDIAILSRKRDGFFNQLENFLQESAIPVVSNSRNNLLDEVEIEVLLNYLKIALNMEDDIALLSVLLSGLGGFSLDEIAEQKINSEQSLCNIIKEDKNQKFLKFNKNLQDFCFNLQIFGAKDAFLKLFNETNYRAYLNMRTDCQKVNVFVDKFLSEIEACGYNFDLPSLISYFKTVDIVVAPEPSLSEDSMLLTTIHNSKGLEYPIVFLINCDQSLKKSVPKGAVEINEQFGLALKYYDVESNSEVSSAKMLAIKEAEAQKDFIEELMIFYVALTRAKNRIYLFGEEQKFDKYSLKVCDSYFDLIFYCLKNVRESFLEAGYYEDDKMQVCYIEEVEQIDFKQQQNFEDAEYDEDLLKKIDDALSYKYQFDDKKNFKLKETVTSLNQKNQEDNLEKYSNESISFGGQMIEIGNAYHLALKVLNFDDICSMETLDIEIEKNKECLADSMSLVDKQVLLKNIFLLKRFTDDADKVFKEKEFVMKDRLCDILDGETIDDKILVQGIIDLFTIKDGKIVLVDFKYSNSANDNYLIEKYRTQLKAYKMALESALNLQVSEVYLLSLKNSKLLNINTL